MPHDRNGTLLTEGSIVNLLCKVLVIGADGPDCNLTIEALHKHENGYRPTVACNAKLVEAVQPLGIVIARDNTERIIQSKDWRKRLDVILQEMKEEQRAQSRDTPGGRNIALSITHLEDAITRLGQRMKDINEAEPGSSPNPYPESYNPANAKVEPTADGLKL